MRFLRHGDRIPVRIVLAFFPFIVRIRRSVYDFHKLFRRKYHLVPVAGLDRHFAVRREYKLVT